MAYPKPREFTAKERSQLKKIARDTSSKDFVKRSKAIKKFSGKE